MFDKIQNEINKVISKIINTDDSHEFKPILSEIEDAPLSPIGRFTFWLVVSIITITILWVTIAKVDIVISAKGVVIADGESKIIQPLDTGVISKILVKEGDFVKKGQTLMEIDPATTEPQVESIQKNLEDTLLEIERLNATASGKNFNVDKTSSSADVQQNLYSASIATLNNQIAVKNSEYEQTLDELKSAKEEKRIKQEILNNLSDKEHRMSNVVDVIAFDEYQKVVNDVKTLKAEIIKLNYKINELNSKKIQINKEIRVIKEDFRSKNLDKLADKIKSANELRSNADQIIFRNSKQSIKSPCDGYVDKLFIHTIGGVVTPAQQLFAITPDNTPILVKAIVLNQDIGFVKEGMPASIKIDTFSFQKYGMIEGRVKTVSKNSIEDEKLGRVYEVYITPLSHTLKVEGKDEEIRTGMSLNAEINVGKRRIIEFFIYPLIKYLDEGLSVR
ncbi:MAG: HlyD family type I secretion periplasmic adaptor subunit [Candidatus Melainabacteria bacterium]|nr:MAG: HlyD family type I secretion periplasmic adaptor subunit [Candidatus Melainabacteria bacterium]